MKTRLLKKYIAVPLIIALVLAAVPARSDVQAKTKYTLKINGTSVGFKLYKNKTAKAFKKKLPLSATMSKLNGNEIYYYADFKLPTKAKKVGKIKKGDIMLYGNDCIVIFYKSFSTPYSYTKIGRVSNTKKLAKCMKGSSVKVKFGKR